MGIKQSVPKKLASRQNFLFRASKQVDNEVVVIQNECCNYFKITSVLFRIRPFFFFFFSFSGF